MSDRLPTHWSAGPPTRQAVRAARAMEKADEAVFAHFLAAEYARQCEEVDNAILGEIIKAALASELDVYDWAMERVGGSAAKAQLVAEKISLLSKANSARIARSGLGG